MLINTNIWAIISLPSGVIKHWIIARVYTLPANAILTNFLTPCVRTFFLLCPSPLSVFFAFPPTLLITFAEKKDFNWTDTTLTPTTTTTNNNKDNYYVNNNDKQAY